MSFREHEPLLECLVPAVLTAGQRLMQHRAGGVRREQKSDGSPVSAADREAEAIILEALDAIAGDTPVIAEEAFAAGQLPAFDDRAFLVDALDGTKEFFAGTPDFTVNVALVEGHEPVFGIVLAPAAGRLFATAGPAKAVAAGISSGDLAGGAAPRWRQIATVEPDRSRLRLITSRSHRAKATDAFLAPFAIAEDIRMGSSIKFGIIAAGEADLYPRFGPTSAWDIAAGHAVLVAAGGAVTTPDGKPFKYLDNRRVGEPEPFLNGPFVAWGRPSLIELIGA